MNSKQLKYKFCRICLGDDVWLNWNRPLYEFYDTTYKDCYFKFCQLEESSAFHPFPEMLCKKCSETLQNTHSLILKALESHKLLQEEFSLCGQLTEELKEGDINSTREVFETVLIEKIDDDSLIDNDEGSDEELIVGSNSLPTLQQLDSITMFEKVQTEAKETQYVPTKNKFQGHIMTNGRLEEEIINVTSNNRIGNCNFTRQEFKTNSIERNIVGHIDNHENSDEDFIVASSFLPNPHQQFDSIRMCEKVETEAKDAQPVETTNKFQEIFENKSLQIEETVEENESNIHKENQTNPAEKAVGCEQNKQDLMDSADTKECKTTKTDLKVKKNYKKPRMCSICSKILSSDYALRLHEQTHLENRERKETCKVCGVKYYNKRGLYSHMRIHRENRKKIKCEFCDSAFYFNSELKLHRRKHLDQMISCSLCSKQYIRKWDLDRHMKTHSAEPLNHSSFKRSKYFVRCKQCDKSVPSKKFRAHSAAHMNEPLMKCSICDKEYFVRNSCVAHLRKVHQISKDYRDFIVVYKKERTSYLFVAQTQNMYVKEN